MLRLPVSDLRQAPLLSVLIASLAEDHSKAAIARAAHAMIPWTAALTVLMVAFAFGVAGYWCEGAVAGLGGGLSFAYLSRSAARRIDTDQLNLGLFYLLFGLALWAGRIKTRRAGLAAAAVMGVAAHLFDWWYGKPELIYMPVVAGFVWLNYVLGNRAIFYAAPAFWFGGAWVVMALARYACARLGAAGSARQQAAVTAMAVCLAAGTAYGASPRSCQ